MTIKEYLEKTGHTYRSMARECNISPSMVYRLAIGERGKKVSLDIAQAIVKGTGNAVSLDDLLNAFKK